MEDQELNQVPNEQINDEANDPVENTDDEYSNWLRSKGIDPDDRASIVKVMKANEDKVNDLSETVNYLNHAVMSNSSKPTPRQEPNQPKNDEEAWEMFTSMNPFMAITNITQQVVKEEVSKAKAQMDMDNAIAAADSEILGKNPQMAQMIKQKAIQLLNVNPSIGAKGVTNKERVKNLYKEAEKQIKQEAEMLLGFSGFKPDETLNNEPKPRGIPQGGNMMNFMPSNNRSLPKSSGKVDQAKLAADYEKAVEKGDVDTILSLKLRHPEIAGASRFNND